MKDNADAGGSPVVSLRALGKVIGGKAILSNMSIDIEPGSIVGLRGQNGAGKTSLIDVLLGFSPPSSGSSHVFGEHSFHLPAAAKRRIGFVPQQDELLDSPTGAQQLALNAALHPAWDEVLIARLVREWGIPLDRRIQVLSGGERQKLKESVVRVTLLSRDALPAHLGIDGALSQRSDGRRAQVVLTGWRDERQRELADRLGADVSVEARRCAPGRHGSPHVQSLAHPARGAHLYAPVVGVNTIAGLAARGSRRLQLRSGEPRNVLYAIAARLAWQSLALLGIPFFGLALVAIGWALRALARTRWYGTDWLQFRAERETAPFTVRRVQIVAIAPCSTAASVSRPFN